MVSVSLLGLGVRATYGIKEISKSGVPGLRLPDSENCMILWQPQRTTADIAVTHCGPVR